jgi:hypothetical protein
VQPIPVLNNKHKLHGPENPGRTTKSNRMILRLSTAFIPKKPALKTLWNFLINRRGHRGHRAKDKKDRSS